MLKLSVKFINFEWLYLPLKEQSNKKPPINKLYYPRSLRPFVENSARFKLFFGADFVLYSGQSNFEFGYLVKFQTEFENILGYKSGV
jgi:hypothetical protein